MCLFIFYTHSFLFKNKLLGDDWAIIISYFYLNIFLSDILTTC
ncbi:hypothetical protein HMPREF9148_00440 [Prevotella sp. F0091]|nr:hypothetical protein HMPREF9148_00440 [Prevotella sp. F0091]